MDKKYYTYAIIVVLLAALGLRLFYFAQTFNMPQFWDSTEYLSYAKHIALGTPEWHAPGRTVFFPAMISIFYTLGIGEAGTIAFEIFCSVAAILAIYLILKRLYNPKTAIAASACLAFFWASLFWSIRVTVDFPAFLFQMLAILFFFRWYDNKKFADIAVFIISTAIACLIKMQSGLLVISLAILLCLKWKKAWIWMTGIAAVGIIFFLTIGKSLIVAPALSLPIAWNTFLMPFDYCATWWLPLFIIGFIFCIALFDRKENLFMLILLAVNLAFFAFYARGADERWLLMISLPVFAMVGKGFEIMYDFGKKHSKIITIALIAFLFISGAYAELQRADTVINAKKDSYWQVKEAAFWMKNNSLPGDVIFSNSLPQTVYYSERQTYSYYSYNESLFQEYKPKFLVISAFENNPQWIFPFTDKHNDTIVPVWAYWTDNSHTQPMLIVYAINPALYGNESCAIADMCSI